MSTEKLAHKLVETEIYESYGVPAGSDVEAAASKHAEVEARLNETIAKLCEDHGVCEPIGSLKHGKMIFDGNVFYTVVQKILILRTALEDPATYKGLPPNCQLSCFYRMHQEAAKPEHTSATCRCALARGGTCSTPNYCTLLRQAKADFDGRFVS